MSNTLQKEISLILLQIDYQKKEKRKRKKKERNASYTIKENSSLYSISAASLASMGLIRNLGWREYREAYCWCYIT